MVLVAADAQRKLKRFALERAGRRELRSGGSSCFTGRAGKVLRLVFPICPCSHPAASAALPWSGRVRAGRNDLVFPAPVVIGCTGQRGVGWVCSCCCRGDLPGLVPPALTRSLRTRWLSGFPRVRWAAVEDLPRQRLAPTHLTQGGVLGRGGILAQRRPSGRRPPGQGSCALTTAGRRHRHRHRQAKTGQRLGPGTGPTGEASWGQGTRAGKGALRAGHRKPDLRRHPGASPGGDARPKGAPGRGPRGGRGGRFLLDFISAVCRERSRGGDAGAARSSPTRFASPCWPPGGCPRRSTGNRDGRRRQGEPRRRTAVYELVRRPKAGSSGGRGLRGLSGAAAGVHSPARAFWLLRSQAINEAGHPFGPAMGWVSNSRPSSGGVRPAEGRKPRCCRVMFSRAICQLSDPRAERKLKAGAAPARPGSSSWGTSRRLHPTRPSWEWRGPTSPTLLHKRARPGTGGAGGRGGGGGRDIQGIHGAAGGIFWPSAGRLDGDEPGENHPACADCWKREARH